MQNASKTTSYGSGLQRCNRMIMPVGGIRNGEGGKYFPSLSTLTAERSSTTLER